MALQPLQTVVEAYVTNIGYQGTGSATQAALFIAAAMEIQIRRPQNTVIDGQVVTFDAISLQKQIDEARRWIASPANPATSATSGIGGQYYDQSLIRGY